LKSAGRLLAKPMRKEIRIRIMGHLLWREIKIEMEIYTPWSGYDAALQIA
jgi:hypothetical protein